MNVDGLPRLQIKAVAADILGARVDSARILVVDTRLETIAAAGVEPVASTNAGAIDSPRGHALRSVILRTAIDVVEGQSIVDGHAVELGDRKIVEVTPRAAVIVGFVEAAIVAFEQVIGV